MKRGGLVGIRLRSTKCRRWSVNRREGIFVIHTGLFGETRTIALVLSDMSPLHASKDGQKLVSADVARGTTLTPIKLSAILKTMDMSDDNVRLELSVLVVE